MEIKRQMRGLWESCEGATENILRNVFISDVTIRCAKISGAHHATEITEVIFSCEKSYG